MNQARQNEPGWVAVSSNRLRNLQKMLDFTQAGVGIAVIDQRIEKLHRLPNVHAAPARRQEGAFLVADKIERLMFVIEPVEFPNAGPSVRLVVTELLLFLGNGTKLRRR